MEEGFSELSRYILEAAKRDMVNNVGRVLIEELLSMGYTRSDVTRALQELQRKYRVVVVGDYIKVLFDER